MTIGNGDLSQRREECRDMRQTTTHIVHFNLAQIKSHFDENLEAIISLGSIADAIVVEKPREAEAIWRAQFLLVEGALDFYMHELSKYGIQKMFNNEWASTESFANLKVPMSKVVSAINHPESLEWLMEYANDKVSHEVYLEPGEIKKQCSLLDIHFDDACNKASAKCKAKLKELYQRRNQIAHQMDRRHEDASLEIMTKHIVTDAIDVIQRFVRELHIAAENRELTN